MKKKYLCSALAAVMLAGCGGSGAGNGGNAETLDTATYVFTSDLTTLDYYCTQNATDGEITTNCVDGLMEKNQFAGYSPCLAESYEFNDDQTVWTFHLRDAKWVTNTGDEYADVVADDFVAGLQHLADFNGQTMYIATMFIKGLEDYATGKDTDFSHVGVKAIDDKTIEYTLTEPTPYFDSVASYVPFFPVNRTFLEEQGDGCKLGNPDPTNCGFGSPSDASSILYNGGFIFDHATSKSEQVLTKNNQYWDAENVHINTIKRVYDDGSDPSSTVNGFNNPDAPYYQAILLASGPNFQEYLEQYKENAYNGQQNAYTFGVNFNMNRITFDTTTPEHNNDDTKAALLNTNFRKALRFSLDRTAYLSTYMDPTIATAALRSIECPWSFVSVDGKPYGQMVQEASEDPTLDLSEGQDSLYNPEKALGYVKAAAEEMPDATFPIHLDILTEDGDPSLTAATASLKDSIEKTLTDTDGKKYVVVDVHPVSSDKYTQSAYTSTGPVDADWDISTSTGWGYDYVDPKSYLNIFSPVNGDVLRQSMGLEFYKSDDSTPENDAAIEKCGLMEYQKMLDEAYAITDPEKRAERYEAEAKAEAFLLDQAIYIPMQTQSGAVNWRISRVVPFSGPYQGSKFKWVVIQKDPITKEAYDKAYEEWLGKCGK